MVIKTKSVKYAKLILLAVFMLTIVLGLLFFFKNRTDKQSAKSADTIKITNLQTAKAASPSEKPDQTATFKQNEPINIDFSYSEIAKKNAVSVTLVVKSEDKKEVYKTNFFIVKKEDNDMSIRIDAGKLDPGDYTLQIIDPKTKNIIAETKFTVEK